MAKHRTATATFTWEWLGSLTPLSKTLTLSGVSAKLVTVEDNEKNRKHLGVLLLLPP
jgi:hypothetical protein